MTDYFKFQRVRTFLQLNAEACDAREHGFTVESPKCHPHVIMEARPSFGARQFVREAQKSLGEAKKAALEHIDVAKIKADVASMTAEEYKSSHARLTESGDLRITSRSEMVDVLTNGALFSSPIVHLAGARIMATRIAVCLRSLGGDFTCYAETWEKTPEWPALDADGALDARIEVLKGFADDDLVMLNGLATGSLEVTVEEAEKSEPAPTSSESTTTSGLSAVS